jgi:hypothetical protein
VKLRWFVEATVAGMIQTNKPTKLSFRERVAQLEAEWVPRSPVATALTRLEEEHCYGYPEFWDYLAAARCWHKSWSPSVDQLPLDDPAKLWCCDDCDRTGNAAELSAAAIRTLEDKPDECEWGYDEHTCGGFEPWGRSASHE